MKEWDSYNLSCCYIWRNLLIPSVSFSFSLSLSLLLEILNFKYILRLLPFTLRVLATLVLQSSNWQLYRKLYILRTFWHKSAICVVYSNLKDSFRPKQKREINREHLSWHYFIQLSMLINLKRCIGEINSIFGDGVPSRASVYRWYGEFVVAVV